MKVWVVYADEEPPAAVCSTADKAAEWIAGQCGCDKRHDIFRATVPAELQKWLKPGNSDNIEAWRLKWREWRDQYCDKTSYEVDAMEVDGG